MKKKYLSPATVIISIAAHRIICSSITGIEGTGNLHTDVNPNEETEDYLSRRSNNVWDD